MNKESKRILRARILEKYDFAKDFCKAVGMSESVFSLKMRDRREFSLKDAKKIKEILNLSDHDFSLIFLQD